MSRITDPAEKKAVAYEKDYRNQSEYPHAFRRIFPQKKAWANRTYRHQVRQYMADNAGAILQQEELSIPPIRRKTVRKWTPVPLGERVKHRRAGRIRQVAWNYFRDPYVREQDRERFSAFLVATIAVDTAETRALALHWHGLLHGFPPGRPLDFMNNDRRAAWLQAFLTDNPEWDQRLHTWMESALKRTN